MIQSMLPANSAYLAFVTEYLFFIIAATPAIGALFALALLPFFKKTYVAISVTLYFVMSLLALYTAIITNNECTTLSLAVSSFFVGKNSLIIIAIISAIFASISLYSYNHIQLSTTNNVKTFSFFLNAIMFFSVAIIISSGLISAFVFCQGLMLCCYALMCHGHTKQAWKSAEKYLTAMFSSSLLFAIGIFFIYNQVDSGVFSPNGLFFGEFSGALNSFALFCIVYGIGSSVVIPMHGWAINTAHLPSPIVVALNTIAISAGSVLLLKVTQYTFGAQYFSVMMSSFKTGGWVVCLAGASAMYTAYKAWDTKIIEKRLSYSTVTQVSYVIIAACITAEGSFLGANLHIGSHAISKAAMLMIAGLLAFKHNAITTSQLRQIAPKIKPLIGLFVFFGASVAGIPILFGFFGKYYIVLSGITSQTYLGYFGAAIVILGSLVNIAYIFPILVHAFSTPKDLDELYAEEDESKNADDIDSAQIDEIGRTPLSIKYSIIGLSVLNILLSIGGLLIVQLMR